MTNDKYFEVLVTRALHDTLIEPFTFPLFLCILMIQIHVLNKLINGTLSSAMPVRCALPLIYYVHCSILVTSDFIPCVEEG